MLGLYCFMMYAEYRRKSARLSSKTNAHSSRSKDSNNLIEKVWKEIEAQCHKEVKALVPHLPLSDTHEKWKTIRVFVSSTFTDFFNEREVLMKKVFPAVREWCSSHHFRLMECDLRWGVPQDSTGQTTIAACMDEITRCHRENAGKPFFIGMLGERYGWVPSPQDVCTDTEYDWIPGLSVTHMEIQYAAYCTNNPNALFFLRDADFISNLPEHKFERFVDGNLISKDLLHVLKNKLKHRFPKQCFDYSVKYAGIEDSSGTQKVKLSGLKLFEETATTALIAAIQNTYPEHGNQQGLMDDEKILQEQLLEKYSSGVVGRESEIKLLLHYARGNNTNLPTFNPLKDDGDPVYEETILSDRHQQSSKFYQTQSTDEKIVYVSAPSGCGKSVVLAAVAKQARMEGLNVLYLHIGRSPDSCSHLHILRSIIKALGHNTDGDTVYSISLLQEEMVKALEKARVTSVQLLIILDDIDEVDDKSDMSHLFWLPVLLPSRVRCIVSAKETSPGTSFKMAITKAHHMELNNLIRQHQEQLVETFFNCYNKKLSSSQMSALLDHDGASLPLWLNIACEELRLHGNFATLTRKIDSLPSSLPELLVMIIQRLLREDETASMGKLLQLISHSPHGLPETQLLALLGDPKKTSPASGLHWAILRRTLSAFIQIISIQYVHRINFFHPILKQAVESSLHNEIGEDTDINFHKYMADYYEYNCKDRIFDRHDLPYHLLEAKCFSRLIEFYQKNPRGRHIQSIVKRKYILNLRCARPAAPNSPGTGQVVVCRRCNITSSDHCIICDDVVFSSGFTHMGTLCHMHKRNAAPGQEFCFHCGQVIFGGFAPAKQGVICTWCSQGIQFNKCCHLRTK